MATPRTRSTADEKLATSYARESTLIQDSVKEQHDGNQLTAAAAGLRVVKKFTDRATSRSIKDRTDLLAMFAYHEAHPEVGFMVVPELERLTGDLDQRVDHQEFQQTYDVTIVSEADGVVGPWDEAQQAMADQKAVDAAKEVAKIRRRTRAVMDAKVRAGTIMMRPAFGIRMQPQVAPDGTVLPSGAVLLDERGRKVRSGKIEVVEDELRWVVQMFKWIAEDHYSLYQVAHALTAAGVPTKRGAQGWAATTVRGIVTNPLYRGEMTWGKTRTVRFRSTKLLHEREPDDPHRQTFDSPLGALVDVDLWNRANQVLEERRGARVSIVKRTNPIHALDNLIYCDRCGHKSYGRSDGNVRKDGTRNDAWRYWCGGQRPGTQQLDDFGPPCERSHSIAANVLLAALAGLADGDDRAATLTAKPTSGTEADRREVTREIKDLTTRWAKVREMGVVGLYSIPELQVLRVEHEAALADAEATLQRFDAKPASGPLVLLDEQRAALGHLAEAAKVRGEDALLTRAALQRMGISRMYYDGPAVRIELSA